MESRDLHDCDSVKDTVMEAVTYTQAVSLSGWWCFMPQMVRKCRLFREVWKKKKKTCMS